MAENRHWLDGDRLRVYPRMMLALYVALGVAWAILAKDGVDPLGKPLGYDFITFWSASRIAIEGMPADAYSPLRLFEVQREAVPALKVIFAWHYPPTYFLAILPLSLLPYYWSYVTFVLLTLALYWKTVRSIAAPFGLGISAGFFAFPGVFINVLHGQNAFLTGALLGGALLLLERRPVLAGVCAGLLVVKPHLALLLPLAFLCARAWSALIAMIVSAGVLSGTSVALLGVETLQAFFSNLHFVRSILEQGTIPWKKMPTFFAFSSLIGMPTYAGYALQSVGAVAAVGLVGWIWRQPVAYELKAAALVVGTLLISPYLFDYDLALLALPLTWCAMHGLCNGWRYGDRNLLALCWLLPVLVAPVATWSGLQMAPFLLLLLLWLIVLRTGKSPFWRLHTEKNS